MCLRIAIDRDKFFYSELASTMCQALKLVFEFDFRTMNFVQDEKLIFIVRTVKTVDCVFSQQTSYIDQPSSSDQFFSQTRRLILQARHDPSYIISKINLSPKFISQSPTNRTENYRSIFEKKNLLLSLISVLKGRIRNVNSRSNFVFPWVYPWWMFLLTRFQPILGVVGVMKELNDCIRDVGLRGRDERYNVEKYPKNRALFDSHYSKHEHLYMDYMKMGIPIFLVHHMVNGEFLLDALENWSGALRKHSTDFHDVELYIHL